jgi:hypothetical protein
MQLTAEDRKAAMELMEAMRAVVATVREMGPQGAPSTPVYLALQTRGFSFEFCGQLIAKLKELGVLRESGYVLHYVGPKEARY